MAGLAAFIEVELGIECISNIVLLSSDRDFAMQMVEGWFLFVTAHCTDLVSSRSISQRIDTLEITIFLCRLFLFLYRLFAFSAFSLYLFYFAY
jgi:hypothetical protein